MHAPTTSADKAALTPDVLEARDALAGKVQPFWRGRHGALDVDARQHGADLWIVFRRGRGGGLALRAPLFSRDNVCRIVEGGKGQMLALEITNELGRFRAELWGEDTGLEQFRFTLDFTPIADAVLPYFPRDLVPFGVGGDPLASEGTVEARQRKLNTGLVYFSLDRPAFGKVLYVQNLTALNPYFAATGTIPGDAVGGDWPLLGYRAPAAADDQAMTLPAGRATALYDTRLVIRPRMEFAEAESAWQFLDMLGAVYRKLDKPSLARRDWVGRSRKTLRDLEGAANVRERHYRQLYFHPYTGAEHPDSMVQLVLLSAIEEWSKWEGKRHPLMAVIRRGLARFHDPRLGTLRRYLPDVGDDKNPDAVDSWYLYHPLLSLSNLALNGDARARDLFLATIDYGIRAAQHFEYKWPILYDVRDFRVIQDVAPADNRGQTDVGGIYAWVMLQAFELTSEVRFLDEARKALEAARGMRFDLNYQANLTAWGAAACIRLWRITGRKRYLTLSYVYLASFFHNAQIWESEIGHARHYSNFLGVTCLQDAPYMALYECFDAFAAFERYLDLGGPDLIPAAKMLVTDYCRYALHRAWFYYPDALPPEALAEKQRNGFIDPALSFPVEDLYPDGQPAGQVGQEIYGAGAAMVFATRAFRPVDNAPFVLYCDHFMRALTRLDGTTLSLTIDGNEGETADFALVAKGRKALPQAVVRTLAGHVLEPAERGDGLIAWRVPAHTGVVLTWT